MGKKKTTPDNWEIKDRLYVLTSQKQPLVCTLPTRHTAKRPLLFHN